MVKFFLPICYWEMSVFYHILWLQLCIGEKCESLYNFSVSLLATSLEILLVFILRPLFC